MTFKHLTLGGAAAIALGAMALSVPATSATPATTTTTTTRAPAAQVTPLSQVANANAVLNKLRVENVQGEVVGTVSLVITQSDGKALALSVDASPMLGAGKTVSIQANKAGLDQGRHVLVVALTKAELKALAA